MGRGDRTRSAEAGNRGWSRRRATLSLSQLHRAFPTPPPAPRASPWTQRRQVGGWEPRGASHHRSSAPKPVSPTYPELSDSRERSTGRGRNEGIPEHLGDPRGAQCSRRQPPTLGLPGRAGTPDAWGKGPRKGKWPLLLLIVRWMGAGCHGQYPCR